VDGAKLLPGVWRIIMPLASPAVATLGIFSFMHGTVFTLTLLLWSASEMRTLTVAYAHFRR